MKAYYDEDGCTIYHGDCREILPHVTADVIVTDPPYGMNYESGWLPRRIANDESTLIRDAALALWGDKPALVFGRWSEPMPPKTRIRLVWDKGDWPGMGDLTMPWGQSDEEIYVIGSGFISRKRRGTVLRANRLVGETAHPNEKPVGLLCCLIESCPFGIVLDPFMGSGTTLVAAKRLGRRAIGIELKEQYCEIAAKRLAQRTLDFGVTTEALA